MYVVKDVKTMSVWKISAFNVYEIDYCLVSLDEDRTAEMTLRETYLAQKIEGILKTHFIAIRQVSILPTFYTKLLLVQILKVQKSKVKSWMYFALLRSVGVKAFSKMLMKLTPDGDTIVLKNCRQIGKFTFRWEFGVQEHHEVRDADAHDQHVGEVQAFCTPPKVLFFTF